MKKVILIFMGFIFLCFFLPIVFTNSFKEVSSINQNNQMETNIIEKQQDKEMEEQNQKYTQYNTISLLHTKDGSIEQIDLEEYLYGVVSAEMPADFEMEALKAQAIVARTYTIYKAMTNQGKHNNATICDSSACCQAWISKEDRQNRWENNLRQSNWEKIVEAVNTTKGEIITYNGEPINAFFHSNSGGTTEAPINVWGGSGYPYLQSVQTSGEDAYSQYQSEVTLTQEEVIEKLKEKYPEIDISFDDENAIQIKEYTEGGRVKTISFGNVNLSGVEARTIFGLRSANFTVNRIEDKITFAVIGYGHGVGMSQTGADSLARQGKSCEEIIHHFYTGVEIVSF